MAESTDLAIRQRADVAMMDEGELRRMFSVAKALALSKRFPDAKTADEAFAVILLGRDLGLSPTQALTGIYIVEGKPQIAAVTLAGFVRRSEDYDYRVIEHDEKHCIIEFTRCPAYRPGTPASEWEVVGTSAFTLEEARTAGLLKDKSGWMKYPRNMLFARAMSNGVKWYCPDLMGGIPIYTEADVFESTATEISTGHGDGSEPGWGDMDAESVVAVEAIIERAQALGHAGLSDRATAQMTLSGQPDSVVLMWCERAGRELDEFGRQRVGTAQNDAEPGDVVEVVLDREASAGAADQMAAPLNESEPPEVLREQLNAVLDRIAAEEEAGADEAVMAPLYAEQERLEGLIGNEPGDEGQEAMPL